MNSPSPLNLWDAVVVGVADQDGPGGIARPSPRMYIEHDSSGAVDLPVLGAVLAPVPEITTGSVEHGDAVVVLIREVQVAVRVERHGGRPHELAGVCPIGAEVAEVVAVEVADADSDAIGMKRVRAAEDVDALVRRERDVDRVVEPAPLHSDQSDRAIVLQCLPRLPSAPTGDT